MGTGDYIPGQDQELSVWTENFEEKLPLHSKELGIDAEEADMVQACQDIRAAIKKNVADQATARQSKQNKDAVVSKKVKLLRNGIQRGKKSRGYTLGIGQDLKIIGAETTADMGDYKPGIKASVYPGYVQIDFTKKRVDGVNIYARIKGRAEWQKLALDMHSPYVDNRPLAVKGAAEVREYMAIGVLDDKETGQMSDIAEVVFGG